MNSPKVIVFAGKDRVGKSTFAKGLKERLDKVIGGNNVYVDSFGHYLRKAVSEVFGIPYEWMTTFEGKEKVIRLGDYEYDRFIVTEWYKRSDIDSIVEFENIRISIRSLMIFFGTDIMRAKNPYVWPEGVEAHIKDLMTEKEDGIWFLINDDPREPEDFKYLESRGAMFFFLKNEENPFCDYKNRSEERALEYIKAHIDNFIIVRTYIRDHEDGINSVFEVIKNKFSLIDE